MLIKNILANNFKDCIIKPSHGQFFCFHYIIDISEGYCCMEKIKNGFYFCKSGGAFYDTLEEKNSWELYKCAYIWKFFVYFMISYCFNWRFFFLNSRIIFFNLGL